MTTPHLARTALLCLAAVLPLGARGDSYPLQHDWLSFLSVAGCARTTADPQTSAQQSATCAWTALGRAVCAWDGLFQDAPTQKIYAYHTTDFTNQECLIGASLVSASQLAGRCPFSGTAGGGGCANAAPCGQGDTRNADGSCPTKNPQQCPWVSNPIQPALANKFQVDTDYAGSGPFPLRFARTYNSVAVLAAHAGPQWRHTYDRVVRPFTAPTPAVADVVRPDGGQIRFTAQGGAWVGDADIADRLVQPTDSWGMPTGWQYRLAADDKVETYDGAGKLLSIAQRSGLTQRLTYSAGGGTRYPATAPACNPPVGASTPPEGLLWCVTDPFGRRQLHFSYDASSRLSKLFDPSGGQYQYAYGPGNFLTSVTYPDAAVRTYHYNEAAHTGGANLPYALTGITDENNSRYATFGYDASGRAVSSEHAGGAGRTLLSYGPDSTVVTDALNTRRTYTFERSLGVARNTGVSQPCTGGCGGASAATTYASNGNVASRTDFNGNRTDYAHDLTRNLETQRVEGLTSAGATTPATRIISTEWHSSLRLPTRIAEPKRITAFDYDDNGNLISRSVQATTDGNGAFGFAATPAGSPRTWTYAHTYHAGIPGFIIQTVVDGPRTDVADVTTYVHDAQGNLTSVTNALGHVTTITTHDAHGNPLTLVEPNGLTTTLAYDARQRLTARSVGSETTGYGYDDVGQLTRVTLPDGSFLDYSYDPAHRLVGVADSLGNRIVYTLDSMGNRVREDTLDPTAQLAATRSRAYDALNRLSQDIGGTAAQITAYEYDAQGNLTRITDPLNHVSTQAFDALNRLVSMIDPKLGQTQTGYDGLDQLAQVTDARGLTTAYGVNGLGDPETQLSPDTGASLNTFDAAGNPLTQTDARGVVASYSYDSLNRVTAVAFTPPSGSGLVAVAHTYSYDQGINGIGRLTGMTDATGSTLYAYDPQGRVVNETRIIAGQSYATAYNYDGAGRLTAMTLPSGRTLSYALDALGRVGGISTNLNGQLQSVVSNVTYRPFGALQALTSGNGQIYARSYDLDNRISGHTLGASSVALTYDADSRITGLIDGAVGFGYSYDELDRLVGFVAPQRSQSFLYDAVGNRLSQGIGANSYAYSYSATSNRLQSVTGPTARSYTYDAAGNTLSDGRSYVYGARGRLIQASGVSVASYGLNALGERVTKTAAGSSVVYHYDRAGRLIAETDAGGNPSKEYVWLGDVPVAAITTAPATPSCPSSPAPDPGTTFQPFAYLERLEVRGGHPGAEDWEWGLGVNTQQAGKFVQKNLKWVNKRSYNWRLAYTGQSAGTMTVFDGATQLFSKTWNVARKPLRAGNALRFHVKASSGIPAGNLIAVTVTSINGTAVSTTLQTDGTGNFSQAQAFFSGTGLAQGFTIEGTVTFSFTGRYPPLGSRLNFMVNAGNVDCTQAGAPTTEIAYIQADHLNTPRTVTDSQQRLIWKWDQQDPFGANVPSQDPDGDAKIYTLSLRLPGQYFDAETGLNYNYYRDYDPQTGRYIQSDPIGLRGGINTYVYAIASPLQHIDPLGLAIWLCNRQVSESLGGVGNHAYLWNDKTARCCGRNDGRDPLLSCKEKGPGPGGDSCAPIAGSEGKEDKVMSCCQKTANDGIWVPGVNDCHNSADRCLRDAGLKNPGAPGGRTGECNSCWNKPD